MKNKYILGLAVIFASIIYAHASSTGYTRKTNSNGCSCHGSAKSTITVNIAGPDQVQAGATVTYQVTISGGTGSEVCVDIAASSGSLQNLDSNLKLSNSELITNGTKTYTNGQYTYSFNYTAPSIIGMQTLYATGLASRTSGWNFAPNKIVNVVSPTDVNEISLPREFYLDQNYPNPFNPSTTIKYSIPSSSVVSLKIYDALGKEIRTLVNEFKTAGSYEINFDAVNLASGIYYYTFQSGMYKQSKKMILIK